MRPGFPQLHVGLKAKFVLTISFLILITSVILSVFLIRGQSSMIQMELEKRGELMVRNVAHNAEYGVLVENKPLLLNLMEGLYQEAEVVYINVLDRRGDVLAQWDRGAEFHRLHPRTRSGDAQFPAFQGILRLSYAGVLQLQLSHQNHPGGKIKGGGGAVAGR